MYSIRRTVYPLFVPVALILLSSAVIIKWPDLLKQMHDVKELRAVMVEIKSLSSVVADKKLYTAKKRGRNRTVY